MPEPASAPETQAEIAMPEVAPPLPADVAEAALQFLRRVSLQWDEMDAAAHVRAHLQAAVIRGAKG